MVSGLRCTEGDSASVSVPVPELWECERLVFLSIDRGRFLANSKLCHINTEKMGRKQIITQYFKNTTWQNKLFISDSKRTIIHKYCEPQSCANGTRKKKFQFGQSIRLTITSGRLFMPSIILAPEKIAPTTLENRTYDTGKIGK